MMRALLGCTMTVLALSFSLSADDKKLDKIDAQKLVGKWEHEDKDKSRAVVEFTKDGKVTMALTYKGETDTTEGTYKIEGGQIVMVLKQGGKDEKATSSVYKLTDTELVMTEGDGKKMAFTRVKGK